MVALIGVVVFSAMPQMANAASVEQVFHDKVDIRAADVGDEEEVEGGSSGDIRVVVSRE